MKSILWMVLLAPLGLRAQQPDAPVGTGISFDSVSTWSQVVDRATREHKYIFVDFYATWCGPCKKMDMDVYGLPEVGRLVNKDFISIKLQVDTSASDNPSVKSRYTIAHDLAHEYSVKALPSYLFFSPSGQIVHRGIGYMDAGGFDSLIAAAQDTNLRFYALLDEFRKGTLPYSSMPGLADQASGFGQHALANEVGRAYLKGYLYTLPDTTILHSKKYLNLIWSYTQGSNERGFKLFFDHQAEVDGMMGLNYAQKYLDYWIKVSDVKPFLDHLKDGAVPEWDAIEQGLTTKYGTNYAHRNVLVEKVVFYYNRQDWPLFSKFSVQQVQDVGTDTTTGWGDSFLNNTIWDAIVEHNNNKDTLDLGIQWMEGIIRRKHASQNSYDTYAWLLYKRGYRDRAIDIEKKAVEMARGKYGEKGLEESLKKMQEGTLTGLQFNEFGEKKVIDSTAIRNWEKMGQGSISDNGRYFMCTIYNRPVKRNTTLVKAVSGDWSLELTGIMTATFVNNGEELVFVRNDSIMLLKCGANEPQYIGRGTSFKTGPFFGKNWLGYTQNDTLVIRNLSSSFVKEIPSVTHYAFGKTGDVVFQTTEPGNAGKYRYVVHKMDLNNVTDQVVWSAVSEGPSAFEMKASAFSASGERISFIIQCRDTAGFENEVWYFRTGMPQAVRIVDNGTSGIKPGYTLSDQYIGFGNNPDFIFFHLSRQIEPLTPPEGHVKVDVWNYKDVVSQSVQLDPNNPEGKPKTIFTASKCIDSSRVIQIDDDIHSIVGHTGYVPDDCMVIAETSDQQPFYSAKEFWGGYKYYILSLRDGARKLVRTGVVYPIALSPTGKYVVYFDWEVKAYFSYEVQTGTVRKIISSVQDDLESEHSKYVPNYRDPAGIGGWENGDSVVYIYGYFDIWKVDPLGKEPPVNITHGYGKRNHIHFTFLNTDKIPRVTDEHGNVVLSAFCPDNKYNGYFKGSTARPKDPEKLNFGPYARCQLPDFDPTRFFTPIKAVSSNLWLTRSESATMAPNYYVTSDFAHFTAMTDLEPQRGYNWLTTELITWRQFDGTFSQGILYKPENFDPHKKYPVIFNYYEVRSNELNVYEAPDFIHTDINIPLLVSQGYIVVVPDIHFSIAGSSGKSNGENAYNSIVSAARFVSRFPWVDSTRMGINGHSFAGGITYYLITHTHLFTAAIASAGVCNSISSYLNLGGTPWAPGGGRIEPTEIGQGRMYVSLWERPDLYNKGMSILRADKVTTPLLIMHNMKDYAVPWEQGVEMFLALQRLGKKVWMLQYDDGNHGLFGQSGEDYTIRFTQFFDHYLKGDPEPKWMTVGIPARLKGIERGLELDRDGKP